MGRTRHLTWTLTCDHCGKDGGEHGADGTLPEGWVEGGKAFCSEECVIEDARAWYREGIQKSETVAA